MNPQVPFSDPPAVRATVYWRRRRIHLQRRYLRAIARLRPVTDPPKRPIFVIGCPRSGTTLLFRLLRRHERLDGFRGEGHVLWTTFQHPRDKGWSSDRATADDIRPWERRFVYSSIARIASRARFLDKTPRNCLKVPYLAALFPDATFVLLTRDGPDTVGSLIEGWHLRHGVTYRLPVALRLPEYRGRMWSYVLPPGWRDMIATSVAEIAARQYAGSYGTVLDDLQDLPPERVRRVRFEDLVEHPVDTARDLLEQLSLTPSRAVLDMAAELDRHQVQITSPPRKDKWLDRRSEIERILPLIEPTMERLGYSPAKARRA